jgi:hypothetical protein
VLAWTLRLTRRRQGGFASVAAHRHPPERPCYDGRMAQPPPPSVARLASLAGLLHFGFDCLFRAWPATTPPHLLTPYMSEVFRDMLEMLGRTPVSGVTSFVNGVISAIFAIALQGVTIRRLVKVAGLLTFLWLVTGGLTFALYLDAPRWLVVSSLAAGLPRAVVVAFFLERSLPPPAPPEEEAAEAAAGPGDDGGGG